MNFGQQAPPPVDQPVPDTAEIVHISSLALLKMLKHGRAGVPMEVMGLMLGEFVDEYTVQVVDVFAMPQSGTGVSVEAVDPVFQTKMLDQLKQTNRPQVVVGWYHSHPGFGCWLSGVDMNTQQSFEALNKRAVSIVVDPIQSVKGKVVIDAFRLINPQLMLMNQAPRQTTSNLGHLRKPSIQALIRNLNRHYYSINISYNQNELEQKMLLNLHKKTWSQGLEVTRFDEHATKNEKTVTDLLDFTKKFGKRLEEEEGKTKDELAVMHVGKIDPKKHLESNVEDLMTRNMRLGLVLSRTRVPMRAAFTFQTPRTFASFALARPCTATANHSFSSSFSLLSSRLPPRRTIFHIPVLGVAGKVLALLTLKKLAIVALINKLGLARTFQIFRDVNDSLLNAKNLTGGAYTQAMHDNLEASINLLESSIQKLAPQERAQSVYNWFKEQTNQPFVQAVLKVYFDYFPSIDWMKSVMGYGVTAEQGSKAAQHAKEMSDKAQSDAAAIAALQAEIQKAVSAEDWSACVKLRDEIQAIHDKKAPSSGQQQQGQQQGQQQSQQQKPPAAQAAAGNDNSVV